MFWALSSLIQYNYCSSCAHFSSTLSDCFCSYYIQQIKQAVNLGNGHLPLSRSSATNCTSTDLHRSNSDKTAICVIAPSSWLDADVDRMTNENCRRVSKQDFANDSRSLRLDSVSENTISAECWIQNTASQMHSYKEFSPATHADDRIAFTLHWCPTVARKHIYF